MSGSKFGFLINGVTRACFNTGGMNPCGSDILTTRVMMGNTNRVSMISGLASIDVGSGSRAHGVLEERHDDLADVFKRHWIEFGEGRGAFVRDGN